MLVVIFEPLLLSPVRGVAGCKGFFPAMALRAGFWRCISRDVLVATVYILLYRMLKGCKTSRLNSKYNYCIAQ